MFPIHVSETSKHRRAQSYTDASSRCQELPTPQSSSNTSSRHSAPTIRSKTSSLSSHRPPPSRSIIPPPPPQFAHRLSTHTPSDLSTPPSSPLQRLAHLPPSPLDNERPPLHPRRHNRTPAHLFSRWFPTPLRQLQTCIYDQGVLVPHLASNDAHARPPIYKRPSPHTPSQS